MDADGVAAVDSQRRAPSADVVVVGAGVVGWRPPVVGGAVGAGTTVVAGGAAASPADSSDVVLEEHDGTHPDADDQQHRDGADDHRPAAPAATVSAYLRPGHGRAP